MNNPDYQITRLLIRNFIRLIAKVKVIGLENIPTSGGYIIASNHLGRLDAALGFCFLDNSDVIMLVAEKYQGSALYRWLVRRLNAIWVDRFNADFGALRAALTRLRKGGVLVMAPEGTRSQEESLIRAHPGASFLAVKAGVPVVPVAVTGTEDRLVKASLRRLRRPGVTVRIGTPFTLPPLNGQGREAALERYTDEIMCRIGALLPPPYRGVYADHPRLLELTQETPDAETNRS
ncbi:MAG TPA: lysophospholipid acyltransferase family protein [Anaerolineales bacterium]